MNNMKEYEANVMTYSVGEDNSMELLEEWSGSELFEAATELEALNEAVNSLKREHEEGLIGNPVGTKAETMVAEEFMQGAVMWNINDFKYIDIVKMKEWE